MRTSVVCLKTSSRIRHRRRIAFLFFCFKSWIPFGIYAESIRQAQDKSIRQAQDKSIRQAQDKSIRQAQDKFISVREWQKLRFSEVPIRILQF